jgi:hypothetical protein
VLRLIEKNILAGRWEEYISGNYYDIIEYAENANENDSKSRESNITISSDYSSTK